jgi:glycosyltransferase involved in cell wall biosynthesis
MKISLYAPNLAGGGAERISVHLANGFAARGCKVDAVLLKAEGVYLAELSPGVRIVDLHARRMTSSVLPLARYLRSETPDVLLSAHLHISIGSLLARLLARVPTCIVPTLQTTPTKDLADAKTLKIRMLPPAIKWSFSWADAIVACSQGVADDFSRFIGIPSERIRVIYNPAVNERLMQMSREPVTHPWFAPGQPRVVLGVGRFQAPKDFLTVVRAFALLRKRRDLRLVILGEGDDQSRVEQLAVELGVKDDVSFPGFVQNPFAYLTKAAVFVFSSLWEGLPTVLIEALALNAPIVATDCDCGPREILQAGRYGRLVPVGDAEAMARALEAALSEPRLQVPAEYIRQFTLEAAIDNYLKLFDDIAEKKSFQSATNR